MVLTCRKKAWNKRKQFSIYRNSLSASGNKFSPPLPKKNIYIYIFNGFPLSTNFSDGLNFLKKGYIKKKNGFHGTIASPLYGLEDSFKNTFPNRK